MRQPDIQHVRKTLQLLKHAVPERLVDVDGGQRLLAGVARRAWW